MTAARPGQSRAGPIPEGFLSSHPAEGGKRLPGRALPRASI